ncbi:MULTISPECIES: GNAT family N-acetyltransferase [Kocuria]|uniref:GNAT family N-acetyltransferase n=1 Tax=Kocuria TaxID=57493 RepID=UPI00103DDC16|nr:MULTISPECIES: GNAT family N-acetyltransferase [Kocuria]QBJ20561.1 GNAT family N-acetyltransferase [Kocuria indica]QIR68838.1 GNAT family N-acetyltransferase [Kocuria sp. KD4]
MADICLAWHEELTGKQLDQLGELFDAEYRADEGAWDPDAPYGYAPAALHVMAVEGGRVVGHVGTQRRMISVGDHEVLVAGTGGVLVSPSHRGQGLGARLLVAAQDAARSIAPAHYGYLGCREEVVPFYESCGYKRIEVTERFRSRDGSSQTVEETGAPVMVSSGTRDVGTWPQGSVDLRGRCW